MEEALTDTLRIGDFAARYSDRQLVVLLPTCTYESSMLVATRVLANFSTRSKGNKISIKVEYEEVNLSHSILMK